MIDYSYTGTDYTYPLPTGQTGWKCPVCNRGVAPDEKTCDHAGVGLIPIPAPEPRKPGYPYQPYGTMVATV